jgi:hypothetical protein
MDGGERDTDITVETPSELETDDGRSALAGLPLPAVFSPAAFDAAPGDVCGPDGC